MDSDRQLNLHDVARARARSAAARNDSAGFHRKDDVVLSPTVAHETPKIGRLDPTNSMDEIIERLMEWVAFTPLQNATGDPAISLPLATTASGLPQGMMFGAGRGREATLLELAFELEEAYRKSTRLNSSH